MPGVFSEAWSVSQKHGVVSEVRGCLRNGVVQTPGVFLKSAGLSQKCGDVQTPRLLSKPQKRRVVSKVRGCLRSVGSSQKREVVQTPGVFSEVFSQTRMSSQKPGVFLEAWGRLRRQYVTNSNLKY